MATMKESIVDMIAARTAAIIMAPRIAGRLLMTTVKKAALPAAPNLAAPYMPIKAGIRARGSIIRMEYTQPLTVVE